MVVQNSLGKMIASRSEERKKVRGQSVHTWGGYQSSWTVAAVIA